MSPVFQHGDLRLYLLLLLDETPRHGYDLIQALTDRTGGTYTPSAGTIYPRLAKLEEEGLVTKTVDGRKTIYEITGAGRAEVNARRDDIDKIESGLADSVRLIADGVRSSVQDAMRSLNADLAAAAQSMRATAQPAPPRVDARAEAREQLHRADATLTNFRSRVRTDLRTQVARGGKIDTEAITAFIDAMDEAARALTAALQNPRRD